MENTILRKRRATSADTFEPKSKIQKDNQELKKQNQNITD